jgi:hypothetical protein
MDVTDADVWVMDPRTQYFEQTRALKDTDLFRVRGIPPSNGRPRLVWQNDTASSILAILWALTRYAQHTDLAHLPAWARFRRNIGDSGDVGIWHETYLISEGQYENIYHNMPPFGLGRVGQLVEATGHRESALKRIHSRSELTSTTKGQHE